MAESSIVACVPNYFYQCRDFSVRDGGVIRKLADMWVLGINEDGMQEVLSIAVGENESSKYGFLY